MVGSLCKVRRRTPNHSSKRTASPPLNSSVRLHKRFRVSTRSTPASRLRFASTSFLRCVSGQPARVVCRRFVGLRNVRASGGLCIHFVLGGRGASQRHHFGQRFVCRAQAFTISRSCGVFGMALSSIKGRASVPPNSSFKADGFAAA